MTRLNRLILLFSILFVIFIVGPALLDYPFPPYPLMMISGAFDLLTPLVLIPIYWLLFEIRPDKQPCRRENLIFLVFASLWVLGQGMHLAANSISHLIDPNTNSDLYQLAYFYDEQLSHYLWHAGMIALAVLLLSRQWRNPFTGDRSVKTLPIVAGIIYGFTFFLAANEGGTVIISYPFTLLVVIFGFIWGRKNFDAQPILFFFFIASLVSALFLTGWGLYWGGWPEFSEVGLL
jgi:hypothetical protein